MNSRAFARLLPLILFSLFLYPQSLSAESSSADDPASLPELGETEAAGESAPRLKPRLRTKTAETVDEQTPLLQPKNKANAKDILKPAEVAVPRPPPSVSAYLHTPLFFRDNFDAGFSTFGGAGTVSAPLLPIGKQHYLYGELGLGLTVSQLALTQPSLQFTHLYVWFPFRLRGIFTVNRLWSLEVQAGCQFKLFEYDSRPTLDGGFHLVTPLLSNIEPDIAVGGRYRLSEKMRLRAFAGYLFFAAGVEWVL